MTSLGKGADRPAGDTLQRVTWHPNEKIFVGEFTKNSGQTKSDMYKGAGWHSPGGDTRVKSIKVTVMSKKRSSVFPGKNTVSCCPGWHQPYWRHWIRIRAFDWYRKWWPWMNLKGVMDVIPPNSIALGRDLLTWKMVEVWPSYCTCAQQNVAQRI